MTSDALKDEITAYVENEGERWTALIESERRVPSELWDELRDRGYLRLAAPVELGGQGLAFPRYLELLEIFSQSHGSLRMIVHVANGIWRALLPYANDDQLERFVAPQIRTDIKVAFTLTEPDAGSGADIRCSVSRTGDSYYLTGEKHLITFGSIADYLLLFARLEGTRGANGMVALMVRPRGEGIDNRLMPEGMGLHGTDHVHLVFERAPVPVANRLGEEGQGLEVALAGFLGPKPDLARDDLRRSGATRARPRGRSTRRRVRPSAPRSRPGRRLPSGWRRWQPRSRPPGGWCCTRPRRGRATTTRSRSRRWRSCSPQRCCSA